MQRNSLTARTLWTTILFGVLIATSPNWLNNSPKATYDAPWIYPGQIDN